MLHLFSSRNLLAAVSIALLTSTTGCSLVTMGIGTGIGAAIPQRATVATNDPALTSGNQEEIDAASRVSNDTGERAIGPERVRDVPVKSGTHWEGGMMTGLIVGGAVDIACTVLVLASIHNIQFSR